MEKGYTQVYTGNGKGKTTCMLGLTLRAVGAGKRVYIGQFLKDDDYSEIKALRQYLPMVALEQFGGGNGFVEQNNIRRQDAQAAASGYQKALHAISTGEYDLVVLDEINVAVHMGLLSEQDILHLIASKPTALELVLTGRYATACVIEQADLVTEMAEIKHYYQNGVAARVGIEK